MLIEQFQQRVRDHRNNRADKAKHRIIEYIVAATSRGKTGFEVDFGQLAPDMPPEEVEYVGRRLAEGGLCVIVTHNAPGSPWYGSSAISVWWGPELTEDDIGHYEVRDRRGDRSRAMWWLVALSVVALFGVFLWGFFM